MLLKERFEKALQSAQADSPSRQLIGTQNESLLHLTLKYFFEPSFCFHEQKVGRFFADILRDNCVTEIQTGAFYTMKPKLLHFLADCGFRVEIVYPIAVKRSVSYIDPKSGEISQTSKGRGEGVYSIMDELIGIKKWIRDPKLTVIIAKMEIEEHRLLNPKRKNPKLRARRVGRVPKDIIDIVYLNASDDYKIFIPNGLPEEFTSKDFAKSAKISVQTAQLTLNLLTETGTVSRIGKNGKAFVYTLQIINN